MVTMLIRRQGQSEPPWPVGIQALPWDEVGQDAAQISPPWFGTSDTQRPRLVPRGQDLRDRRDPAGPQAGAADDKVRNEAEEPVVDILIRVCSSHGVPYPWNLNSCPKTHQESLITSRFL